MERKQVQFYATLLGGIFSLAALTYILVQHKKNKAAFEKQDYIMKVHGNRSVKLNIMNDRLRNLELAQCSNPYVRQNPELSNLLNCPPVARQQQQQAVPPGPPPPPRMQTQGVMPAAYAGRTNAAASQNLPPMPNYGFFGDGPAGTSSGATMMGAFATDTPGAGPVPFQK